MPKMNCKHCNLELIREPGLSQPVARYEFQKACASDPPSGTYCPMCAKQFDIKARSVRVPNPNFIAEVS